MELRRLNTEKTEQLLSFFCIIQAQTYIPFYFQALPKACSFLYRKNFHQTLFCVPEFFKELQLDTLCILINLKYDRKDFIIFF